MSDFLNLMVKLTAEFQGLISLQTKHQAELTEALLPTKVEAEIPREIFQESINNLKQNQAKQIIQKKESIYYLLDAFIQYSCGFIENSVKGGEQEKNREMRKLESVVQVFSEYEHELESFHKTKMPETPIKKIFTHFFNKPLQAAGNRIPNYLGLFPQFTFTTNPTPELQQPMLNTTPGLNHSFSDVD